MARTKRISVQRATANTRRAVQANTAAERKRASSNAARARSRADARQAGAVRSATSSTRSRTMRNVEKNMGGVQRAGRAVDRGVAAVKGAYVNAQAGNTAWQKGLNKGADAVKRGVGNAGNAVGRYQLGADVTSQRGAKRGTTNTVFGNMKNRTVRNVGHGINAGAVAATGWLAKTGYDLATDFRGHSSNNPQPEKKSESTGSSWTKAKNAGRSGGYNQGTAYGF